MNRIERSHVVAALLFAFAAAGCAGGLSPAGIHARPAGYTGRPVVVVGYAIPCDVSCTKMACPGGCCNTCGGGLGLVDAMPASGRAACTHLANPSHRPPALLLTEGRCGGKECSLQCSPLRVGARYRVKGTIELTPAATGGRQWPALKAQRIDLIGLPAGMTPPVAAPAKGR